MRNEVSKRQKKKANKIQEDKVCKFKSRNPVNGIIFRRTFVEIINCIFLSTTLI